MEYLNVGEFCAHSFLLKWLEAIGWPIWSLNNLACQSTSCLPSHLLQKPKLRPHNIHTETGILKHLRSCVLQITQGQTTFFWINGRHIYWPSSKLCPVYLKPCLFFHTSLICSLTELPTSPKFFFCKIWNTKLMENFIEEQRLNYWGTLTSGTSAFWEPPV